MDLSPVEMRSKELDVETWAELLRPRLSVLSVCLSNSWGGLEQVAANDALEVASQGLKVRALVLENSPIHERLSDESGIHIIPLNYRPRNHFDLRLRGEIERQIAQGVNLIHSHQTSTLGSIVPWLWSKGDIAMLATRHILSDHHKKTFYHRAIYRRLDALMVISRSVRRNVMMTHPIREKFIKVVNLGLDFDVFDPLRVDPSGMREEWGVDAETTVIGMVGRIDPAKGQATLIKAAAGLLKSLKPNEKLKFVIVGEETLGSVGGYLDELREMVSQFHLQEYVVFAGFQEDIPAVMSALDVFVMPSRQEAFGLVAIEAMAMECPIVISSGGSAQEIVGHDQEFGLTMRAEDAFDLQRQLRWMLDHSDARCQMGKLAREHVMSNYDRKYRVQKTLEIYDRCLRDRGV